MARRNDGDALRAFDPVVVGNAECDAWAAYYRHEWATFLRAAITMVHAGFAMNWARTLQGAALVLRANQVWAPVPDNDPTSARRLMSQFYSLVIDHHRLPLDPNRAAELEVEWWRAHRDNQRGPATGRGEDDVISSLVALYSYVYETDPAEVRPAATHRMIAMRHSDAWVDAGAEPNNPLLAQERRELVMSYSSLRDAVSLTR